MIFNGLPILGILHMFNVSLHYNYMLLSHKFQPLPLNTDYTTLWEPSACKYRCLNTVRYCQLNNYNKNAHSLVIYNMHIFVSSASFKFFGTVIRRDVTCSSRLIRRLRLLPLAGPSLRHPHRNRAFHKHQLANIYISKWMHVRRKKSTHLDGNASARYLFLHD